VRINTFTENIVKVQEENIETGGNFNTKTIHVNAIKNTTTIVPVFWPFPISALLIDFVSTEAHRGDFISISVGRNTIIGAIAANVTPASAWSSQNYTTGQTVTYTHPIFGNRVYTCIQNTVSNESPTNTIYWRHGFGMTVSPTVITYTLIGFYLKVNNFVTNDDLGQVISVDATNSRVYMENSPTNSYLASSPTYVQQTVYTVKDYEIGEPWNHQIGNSKIGGSYTPANTVVELHYTNVSADTDKVFIGRVEYLY